MTDELRDRRILVPASRAGRSVLADALRTRGATVLEFPRLEVAHPSDLETLDDAARRAASFTWILFSGEHSVATFFARPAAADPARRKELEARLLALGTGTVSALRERGLKPRLAPRRHDAEAILEALGKVDGSRLLLLREETAADALPERLRDAGAEVTAVAGYRLAVHAGAGLVEQTFGPPLDLLAFPNPTAARILDRTFRSADLDRASLLGRVPVAAVGPSTAAAAERYGFPADLVSGGRLADLMRDVVARWGTVGAPRPATRPARPPRPGDASRSS